MLNLQPPFLDVGNLRIYTDDTDKDVFYYVNQKPRLCMNGEGKPALSVYAVVPESGVNKNNDSILETCLSVDIDLSVTDAELEAAREEIATNFKREPKTLSPAPLHKGIVKLMMLQKSDAEKDKKWFVSSGFSPSMIGTNRVSLAVRATGEDAKQLVAALSSNQVAATVYYDLEVVGITPVYKALMRVDMKQVYHHVEERTNLNLVFYNKDIEKIVDELEESHALTIEVEEQDPDIKAEAMKSLMNELKSEVTKLFFTEEKLPSDKVTADSVARGISGAFTNMFKSILPNYAYRRKEVDESVLKIYEINLRQKNAKTFPISPQGQLKEIIDTAGVNIDDCLEWVRVDDLEVKGQSVTVRLAANTFEGGVIKSVVTYCRVVDADSGEQVKEPMTIAFDGDGVLAGNNKEDKDKAVDMKKTFTYTRYRDKNYRYEYWSDIYIDAVPGLLPSPLKTKVRSTESNYIYINPADYYKTFQIDLNLPDQSVLEHANMILAQVDVVSDELEGKTVMSKDFKFEKNDNDHKILTVITEREMELGYKMDFTYVIPGEKDVTLHMDKPQRSSIFLVPNPFENKWEVDLDCVTDWDEVERVVIETRFKDAAKEDMVTNLFTFKEDHISDKLTVECSMETEKRTFEYYYHIYRRDGSKVEGGWIPVENESYVLIDVTSLKPERTIKVRMKNPDDFGKFNLKEVKVFFYPPNEEDEEEKTDYIVKADGVVAFTYPWNKGDSKVYTYKFTAKDKDNEKVFQGKKTKDDSEELLLELSDQ